MLARAAFDTLPICRAYGPNRLGREAADWHAIKGLLSPAEKSSYF